MVVSEGKQIGIDDTFGKSGGFRVTNRDRTLALTQSQKEESQGELQVKKEAESCREQLDGDQEVG